MSFVFKNFGYKLTAILMALTTWYLIQGREVLEINRKLLITVITPDGYGIKQRNTHIRDITLSGPRVLISQFDDQPIPAIVKLNDATTGRRRVRLTRDNIDQLISNQIKLIIHEPYINIKFGKINTKKVSIKEVLRGSPKKGFFVKSVSIEPEFATLSGLNSNLKNIKEALTDTIDISGMDKNEVLEVGLVNPGVKTGNIFPQKVSVKISIDKSKVNKVFKSIPVEILSADYLSKVEPNTVSVVLQGLSKTLDFIEKDDIKASIDLRNVQPGQYRLEVQAKIPPDTVLIETKPKKIQVVVDKRRVR